MGNTVRHRRQRANRRRQHDRAVIAQRVSTALDGQRINLDELNRLYDLSEKRIGRVTFNAREQDKWLKARYSPRI